MTEQPALDGSADATRSALDRRAELSEFLRTRRARLKPEEFGLAGFGRRRRVPGLRREELAQLAGVSVGYYTRLEQGNGDNVSADVLDAIARALRLTDDEHTYLTQLAKPKRTYRKSRPRPQRMRAGLQYLLDSFDSVPAYVAGSRSDILGWNRLAAALLGGWDTLAPQELNGARLVFLSPTARDLFVDWEMKAAATVSQLRMEAGRCPDDPQLASLVGELSVKSADFRRLWAAHDVREKGHGVTRLRHPLVGSLTLSFETFKLSEDQSQTLVTFHAEPGSSSAESLRLLASWAADSATTIR